MVKVKLPFALLAVTVSAVIAAGCGGGDSDAQDSESTASASGNGGTIAMVSHGDGGPFWTVVRHGAEQAAKELGVNFEYQESNNDPQRQAQMIEAAVSQGVDAIAVTAPNPDAIKGALAKATEAGIPFITLNSGSDVFTELGAITHVGQDETVAGEAAGARIKEAGGKKLLCIIHEQGNIGLTQRCNGAATGLGGTVDTLQVKGPSDMATTQTEIKSKLQSDSSYDWALALDPGVGASALVPAIKEANVQTKAATFDLSEDVLTAIKAGDLAFALDQQQYLQGYLAISFLSLYVKNNMPVGGGQAVLTGPGFVDETNIDAVEKSVEDGVR